MNVTISMVDLQELIDSAVKKTENSLRPYLQQHVVIEKITKWQAAHILGYKNTQPLRRLSTFGQKINTGEVVTICPDENGHYNYAEVIELRKKIYSI